MMHFLSTPRSFILRFFMELSTSLKLLNFFTERTVEDHEDILQVYKHMESYPRTVTKRFIFRKDFRKYEVFSNPQVSIILHVILYS